MMRSRWFHRVMMAALSISTITVVLSLAVSHYRDTTAETAFDDNLLRSDADAALALSHLASKLPLAPPVASTLVPASLVLLGAHVPLSREIPRTALTVSATAPRSPPVLR